MHDEASLKSALFKQLLKDEPTFLVLQIANAGATDREVVGNKRTSYWECKHGTPIFHSPGLQQLICQRLANQGFHCRYILWIEDRDGQNKHTRIVHPLKIESWTTDSEYVFPGYDHHSVSEYIIGVHRGDID